MAPRSLERSRWFLQHASDGVEILDIKGNLVEASDSFCRMLGYTRAEMIGMNVAEWDARMPPAELARFVAGLFEQPETQTFETRHRRKDGTIIDVEVTGCPSVLDGQRVLYHEARDITSRIRTMQALAESEARFRAIFEENGSVMLLVEPSSGEIVEANPAASAYYGYGREKLIGMRLNDINILPPEEVAVECQRALREERSHFNFHHRLASGEVRDVEVYTSRVAVDGRPLLFSIIHDVSERKRAEEALRESSDFLNEAQMTASLGYYVLDVPAGVWKSSSVLDELLGIDKEYQRTVEGWTALIHPNDREPMAAYFANEVVGKRQAFDREYRIVRQTDRAERWVHGMGRLEFDAQGQPLKMRGVIHDITERRQAQEALQKSEARYRTAFQTSLDSININRISDGKFIEVNDRFLEITGFKREEVIGRTSLELNIWVDPRDRQRMVELLDQNAHCRGLETRFNRKNGEAFWGIVSASVIDIEGFSCVLTVTRDISGAKAAEDEIRELAFFDPLTHLPNRRLLLDRLQRSLTARNPQKRALLFVDLDDFKTLNDALGHQTGDLMLQEIARRLVACVREAGTVSRLGGDEFVVMLEDLSEDAEDAAAQARTFAEDIVPAIGRPYQIAGREVHGTCSVGIAVFGEQPDRAVEVLQRAEIAMFQAKAAGRSTVRLFAPALQAAVHARAVLEEDLRVGLKDNQFMLYYQPQIDRGQWIGGEALIRWKHPKRGILAPGEFIPLAEETGLILPLGAWVLETACRQIAAWAAGEETAQIIVSVNISARQFRQPGFVDRVLATLGRTGANPRNLKLELTESILLDNVEEVIATMASLKLHGLRFSVDDFGTGYSSLAYLKRLPLDQLKIDRAFVRDILVDTRSSAIAQTIISLGQAMGLSVMAEGVETEEQRELLVLMGCHSFQGFLFSPPLALKDFQLLLSGTSGRRGPTLPIDPVLSGG